MTTTDLTLAAPPAMLATVAAETEAAHAFAQSATAKATRRAYAGAWRRFAAWCQARGAQALPAAPGAVAVYIAALATEGRRVATIGQAINAIASNHRAAGHESPWRDASVRAVWAGIVRECGGRPVKKRAVTYEILAEMVARTPEGLRGARDRALLLVGWSGAFRRGELAAVRIEHLAFSDRGLAILVPRSKTDQTGQGRYKGLNLARTPALCPVRAARAWLDGTGLKEGAFLRAIDRYGHIGDALTGETVGEVVKRYAEDAGYDAREFGGHSLRSGFVTSARKRGATLEQVMAVSHHRDVGIVLGYSQQEDAFDGAGGLF